MARKGRGALTTETNTERMTGGDETKTENAVKDERKSLLEGAARVVITEENGPKKNVPTAPPPTTAVVSHRLLLTAP